jgi:hypothetical protein
MKKIFDKNVLQSFEEKILQHHVLYPEIPNKAEYWECIAKNCLGAKDWIPNNHNPNEDLVTEHVGLKKPSLKSGIISGSRMVFSSHRMSKFDNLNEMLDFLDSRTYDSYLFLSRNEGENNQKYSICYMPSNLWNFSDLTWEPIIGVKGKNKGKQQGWKSNSSDGKISLKIQFSMSNQLWVDVDISLITLLKEIFI